MNDIFNTIKGIGELKYKNIYGFYDEPLMFSCYSATGGLYFILRLPCDDEQWLAVEVSKYRLELLERNDMEVRLPFVNPENGYLYRFYDNDLEFLTPNQLTDDMLPYSGEYLDYENEIQEHSKEVKKEEIYDGELMGIDIDTNQFNFIFLESAKRGKIIGKISPELANRSFVVPSITSVKVETTISFDKLSGDEKHTFILLDVLDR